MKYNYKLVITNVLGVRIWDLKKRVWRFFWKTVLKDTDPGGLASFKLVNQISDKEPIKLVEREIQP